MTAGSFNVSMLLTANAQQARAEIRGTGTDLQALGQSAKTAGATAAAGLKVAEAQVTQLRRQTAGATSNLVAQFNDVGVMLASGQSPFLLAAQQGTQISQALGPLGARGAVQALGGAFLGMLNPVNLAVFAVVAGLGLLGNSLRAVFGEVKSVEDAIGDLEDATKQWQEQARVGSSDLARLFGDVTPEVVELQRRITELKLAEVLLEAASAAKSLRAEFADGRFLPFSGQEAKVADLLNTDALAPGSITRLAPDVSEFIGLLKVLETSDSLDAQADAIARMQEMVLASAGGWRGLNEEQSKFLDGASALENRLRLVQAAQEGIGSAQAIAADQAAKIRAELEQEVELRQLALRFGENSVEVARARSAAEREAFQAQLESRDIAGDTLTNLLALWDAANGVDSGIKGWAASLLDTVGASDDTRRSVQDAWDAVTGAADATNVWAGAMAGVAAQVQGIGAALASLGAAGIANASKEIELEALRAGKSVAEARRAAVEAEIRQEGQLRETAAKSGIERYAIRLETEAKLRGVALDADLADARRAASERDRIATRGGAGGSRASSRQTEGAQRLIASLERELDILRETDPVQKEMLRNREALASATAAERAMIEDLIIAREREREAQEQVQDTWEFSKNAAYDALDALIIQGATASEVMANLARTIAQALLQSALLGSGPLAGIFGGQGTGLFDIIGGALGIPANADGGWISGPGGPRDDKVLSWLSNGEFVVNAAAAARHRPLLEQINSAPRFANGGAVGGAAAAGGFGQAGREPIEIVLTLSDDLDARVGRTAEEVSVKVMRGALEHYDAKMLPPRMAQIQSDPRRRG
jgi:hypothetical protein